MIRNVKNLNEMARFLQKNHEDVLTLYIPLSFFIKCKQYLTQDKNIIFKETGKKKLMKINEVCIIGTIMLNEVVVDV